MLHSDFKRAGGGRVGAVSAPACEAGTLRPGEAVRRIGGMDTQRAAHAILMEVEQIAGRKMPLGTLPDGRRLDVFTGAKDGRIYVRVRESQGPTRLYWLAGISG